MAHRLTRSILLLLFGAFLGAPALSAQTRTVTGKVTELGGEVAIVSALINLEGTTTHTYSNDEGNFSLELPAGEQRLAVRIIGYRSTEIVRRRGRDDDHDRACPRRAQPRRDRRDRPGHRSPAPEPRQRGGHDQLGRPDPRTAGQLRAGAAGAPRGRQRAGQQRRARRWHPGAAAGHVLDHRRPSSPLRGRRGDRQQRRDRVERARGHRLVEQPGPRRPAGQRAPTGSRT